MRRSGLPRRRPALAAIVAGAVVAGMMVPLCGTAAAATREPAAVPLSGSTLTVATGPLGALPLADGIATPSFGPVTITIDLTALTGTLGHTGGTLSASLSGATESAASRAGAHVCGFREPLLRVG